MKNGSKYFCALVGLIFAGCGGGGSSEPRDVDPTLSSIQSVIFKSSCALSSCHGSAQQGNLDLREGASFASLVDVPVDNTEASAEGKLRVVPGDPGASFLIQKLEGPDSGEGVRMPNSRTALPQEEIDVIRQWIEDGALDN